MSPPTTQPQRNSRCPEHHTDFQQHPWCRAILSSPDFTPIAPTIGRWPASTVSNSLFRRTLYTPSAIRAHLTFRRSRPLAPDALPKTEEHCSLISIGDAVDGKTGRAHGGFNSLLLDQISGSVAHAALGSKAPPATATMTLDFRRPIDTPGVVLCRAWVVEGSGRKVWVKGVIEDGEGRVLTESRALFVAPRDEGPKL